MDGFNFTCPSGNSPPQKRNAMFERIVHKYRKHSKTPTSFPPPKMRWRSYSRGMVGERNWINMEDQRPNAKAQGVFMGLCVHESDFKDALKFDVEAVDWKNIQNLDNFLIWDYKRTRGCLKKKTKATPLMNKYKIIYYLCEHNSMNK